MAIILKSTSDYEALIGEQIRKLRFENGLDQAQLAKIASISLGAVKSIEGGKGSSLKTFIKILRFLNEEKWLESLRPSTFVSPIRMLRDQRLKTPRRRVYKSRKFKQ